MAMVQIVGKRKLSGDVAISGSKNSVLPIMAASVLCQGVTILENCPDISDVHDMIKILESLGAKVSFETGTLKIDTTTRTEHEVKEEVAKKLRASILFLGPLLAKDKKVEGLSDVRDESDRTDKVRVVIELKRDAAVLENQKSIKKNTHGQEMILK